MKVITTITVEIKGATLQLTRTEALQLYSALKHELGQVDPSPPKIFGTVGGLGQIVAQQGFAS